MSSRPVALHRLQKILARAGLGSRRSAEQYIVQGRVRVDGVVVNTLGVRVDARRQKVEVDGRLILAEPLLYVVLHKPREMVSTMNDPEGRPTVIDCIRGVESRVVPVGRLDFHTSGVLLLTNDGEFASRLTHPSGKTEKIYVAKVQGRVDAASVKRFTESIDVDGRNTQPAEVRVMRHEGDKCWLQITLREGKNRQIHRLGEAAGHAVLRLARVSFAGISHDGLRPGQWRYLTRDELVAFRKQLGVPSKVHPPPDTRVHEGVGRAGAALAKRRPRSAAGGRAAGGTSAGRASARKPAGKKFSKKTARRQPTAGEAWGADGRTQRASATRPSGERRRTAKPKPPSTAERSPGRPSRSTGKKVKARSRTGR